MNTATIRRSGWLLAPLLLAACASLNVSSQKYPQADFSGYHSYAWIAEDPLIVPAGTEPPVSALGRSSCGSSMIYPWAILPPPRTVPEVVVLVSTIGNRQLLL